jgi:catechol 2,3-dioxygenase-like lactoylglutathione lyase family enzyme
MRIPTASPDRDRVGVCDEPGTTIAPACHDPQEGREVLADMEDNMELHRGRLIDHVQLVVKDLAASKRFYAAVCSTLDIPMGGEGEDYFWADELFVSSKDSKAARGVLTGRMHLAFQAKNREAVERFHREVLAAGGKDNGAPGERPYHPGYYAAFAIDPDGNNVEAVFHGPAERSADSVKITFPG